MDALTTPGCDVSADSATWVRLHDAGVVSAVRRAAATLAQRLGFSEGRCGEVALGATEIATNAALHGVDASVLVRVLRYESAPAVQVVAVDAGPGMADVGWSRVDGHSTSGTLGVGMGAVDRLASVTDTLSVPGKGTALVATFWPGAAPAGATPDVGAVCRPMTGETECGDEWAAHVTDDVMSVLLCDGLGHGPAAAFAATVARETFRRNAHLAPAELIMALHEALVHTRGVAGAVARVRRADRRLELAGVGNIRIVTVGTRRSSPMLCQPGILGHRLHRIRVVEAWADPGALLVLHSDGVNERWTLDDYPPLGHHDSLTIAATLLRDAGLRRDDASVLVVRLP